MTPNARSEREMVELDPVAVEAAARAIADKCHNPGWRGFVPEAEACVGAYLTALPAPPVSVENVARALLDKMDAMEGDLESFFILASAKGIPWRGANYGAELEALRDALSRMQGGKSATAIPEGWVLVPKEPTEAMLDGAWNATVSATAEARMATQLGESRRAHDIKCAQRYRAMLAASPKPEGASMTPSRVQLSRKKADHYRRDPSYGKPPRWGRIYDKYFPKHTCPASRHVKVIAESLRDPKSEVRRLLIDAGYEPDHWASSLEDTVQVLWASRAGHHQLKPIKTQERGG